MRLSCGLVASVWLSAGVSSVHAFTLRRPLSTIFTSLASAKAAPTEQVNRLVKGEISIQAQVEAVLRQNHDNESWNALFVSCPERPDPTPILHTEGILPSDFPPGAYLRLGPNGADASEGFFDGDGMIHCITFPPRTAQEDSTIASTYSTYSATYIETKGRQLERASGGTKKFKGTLGGVPRGLPMIQSILQNALTFQTLQAQKDTCNTAIAQHGGRALALMEQCPPTEIEIRRDGRLYTIEACSSLNGAIDTSAPISGGVLSAHGRTCPKTGDRVHVSYRSDERPYLRLDIFAEGFVLKKSVGIDIPTPIFSHDCVLTENYVVIMDLPLTLRTSRILRDRFPVEYEPDHPARIGLWHRGDTRGKSGEIRWFDCEPGVVLHACNAWEKDGSVIVQGFRGVPTPRECYLEQFTPSYFYEYSIDLTTGVVTEQTLNSNEAVEFPAINEKMNGQEYKSCYCLSVKSIGGPLEVFAQPKDGVSFDTVIQFAAIDTDKHAKGDVMSRFTLPRRWFAITEPTVVPKQGVEGEYIMIIATHVPVGVSWMDVTTNYDEATLTSKVMILDGDDLDAGPVYTAALPYHVPYGLHSSFIDWKHMSPN
jgi:carotenoid cleavage dioxygenase-like enzyme